MDGARHALLDDQYVVRGDATTKRTVASAQSLGLTALAAKRHVLRRFHGVSA